MVKTVPLEDFIKVRDELALVMGRLYSAQARLMNIDQLKSEQVFRNDDVIEKIEEHGKKVANLLVQSAHPRVFTVQTGE